MKCFVLLVIFAIVQNQGVTGFSFITEMEDPIMCSILSIELGQEIDKIIKEFPERFTNERYRDILVKTKIHVSDLMKSKAKLLNLYYRDTLNNLKEIVANIIKKNTQDQSTTENIASDVTTQINTVQTASIPDKLDEFKQQSTTVRNDDKKEKLTIPEDNNFSVPIFRTTSSEDEPNLLRRLQNRLLESITKENETQNPATNPTNEATKENVTQNPATNPTPDEATKENATQNPATNPIPDESTIKTVTHKNDHEFFIYDFLSDCDNKKRSLKLI